MTSSKAAFVLIAVLAVGITSIQAKSIEKRDEKPDYFQQLIRQLSSTKDIPVLGGIIRPYVTMAEKVVLSVDKSTDGNLRKVVNSVGPCSINAGKVKCTGTLDRDSLRKLTKKALHLIPPNMIPNSLRSIIILASDML